MDIIRNIITPPKQVTYTGGGDAFLAKGGRCLCHVDDRSGCLQAATAKERIERTLQGFCSSPCAGELPIVLETGNAPEGIKNADQGYRLTVNADKITLTGFGERGLLYAAVTLCQMLAQDNGAVSLPRLEIVDWPDIEKRGHFIESRYGTNLMELADWQSIVDDLLEKKENIMNVSLYGCWGMQYDNAVCEYVYFSPDKYPKLKTSVITKYYSVKEKRWVDKIEDTPIAAQDFFGELCAYARARGVEVVPLINSYGHNTLIPRMYPEVSAKFADGTPTGNGYCTENPKTYEMLFDIYDAIIDRYLKPNGITSFDVGLDEIDDQSGVIGVNPDDPFSARPAFCECEKCRNIPNNVKFVDHAVRLLRHLKDKGMKTVYVCNDMFFRTFDPKRDFYLTPIVDSQRAESGDTSIVAAADNHLSLLQRELAKHDVLDIIVLNWWKYTDVPQRMSYTPEDIASSGIRSIVKPMNGYYHWNLLRPAVLNSYIMAQYAHAVPDCVGYVSYAGWDRIFDRTNSAQAAFTWNFEKAGTPKDRLREYCLRLFPTQAEKAIRAFELLDLCNREGNERDEKGDKVLDSRTLTERTLAYYLFSYIAKDKPYPRNFPGESMQTILAKRYEHENLMLSVSASAKEAGRLFGEIARDPACSKYYADRYRWEADNFGILCDDYLALLRMHDITVSGVDEEGKAEISRLAANRKNARLALIERAEEIKEHYLLSSHLRNQSVFMQLFADIESYVNTTDAPNIRLDFTDLGPIASAQFRYLR